MLLIKKLFFLKKFLVIFFFILSKLFFKFNFNFLKNNYLFFKNVNVSKKKFGFSNISFLKIKAFTIFNTRNPFRSFIVSIFLDFLDLVVIFINLFLKEIWVILLLIFLLLSFF